jgi:phospholipid/cholesterol/gamma-HCH transport system ATP-binding protein
MNSVIEIGDNIIFIYKGQNWWSGDKKSIIQTENQEIINFVYASEFMKDIKASMQKKV